jgi:PPOX class probable F420-dependent enzyme
MRLSVAACRERLRSSSVARLATVATDGAPHLVPITFAVGDDDLVFAVDQKPKSSTDLARVRNVRRDPRVAVLADHYDDDWSTLWWVRADGRARVLDEPDRPAAIDLLAARYARYRTDRPAGPVVSIRIERLTGWAASDRV